MNQWWYAYCQTCGAKLDAFASDGPEVLVLIHGSDGAHEVAWLPKRPDRGGLRELGCIETHCPMAGPHEHAFRGPHRFHEWETG